MNRGPNYRSLRQSASQNLEAGEISAAISSEERQVEMPGEGNRKIKFKRAKKLNKMKSTNYMKALKDTKASRFEV